MPASRGPVIVVDDDAAVRHSLKFALEIEGFEVRLYAGGAEMLADERPLSTGCLIVDQCMPDMTGIELVDRLRARDVAIPTILITAKATDQLRGKAASRCIRHVFEKPLEGGALFDGVRGAMADADPTRPARPSGRSGGSLK